MLLGETQSKVEYVLRTCVVLFPTALAENATSFGHSQWLIVGSDTLPWLPAGEMTELHSLTTRLASCRFLDSS